jgi:hypothetical protein
LLHFGVCCKSRVSWLLIKGSKDKDVARIHSASRTVCLQTAVPAVLVWRPAIYTSLQEFTPDIYAKQAVTSWLQMLDTHFIYVGIQVLGPRQEKWLNVIDD